MTEQDTNKWGAGGGDCGEPSGVYVCVLVRETPSQMTTKVWQDSAEAAAIHSERERGRTLMATFRPNGA